MKKLAFSLCIAAAAAFAQPSEAPLERRLYVCDMKKDVIRVHDIDHGHKLLKTIDLKILKFVEGVTCHTPTHRLFLSDGEGEQIVCMDLLTDKVVWARPYKTPPGKKFWHLDRLSVTNDGKYLFVPCRGADQVLVLDATNGDLVKTLRVKGNPHNSFVGEQGKAMYLEARSSTSLTVVDPRTLEVLATIPGYSSPLRPICVSPDEKWFFGQRHELGFGVADVRDPDPAKWHKLMEIDHERPEKLPRDACTPHRGHVEGHGICCRPGTTELWFLDDHYGFLYVYDYGNLPERPKHIATIQLFTDWTKPWSNQTFRWLCASTDGRYIYAPNGWVIDAQNKRDTGMRITPGEKMLEVDWQNGVPVQNGGQNGGVYH